MKKLSQVLLPILLGNCLLASVAFAQSEGVTAFNVVTTSRPDTYIVQKGDTLYDLSGTYLGDVLLWPQLWSYNPQITNPHWIYPGDLLFLRANVDADTAAAAQQQPKATSPEAPRHFNSSWVLTREFVPLVAILADKEVKGAGKIVASGDSEAEMLKRYDTLWLTMSPSAEQQPKVGDYYITYHESNDTIDTHTYGDKIPYTVNGVVQITSVPNPPQNPYYGAKIVYSLREMERGDLLLPYQRQKVNIKIHPANKDLVGKIIYSVTPRTQLSEFNYVYLNKGSDDGVEVGNRFFVYQPGGGYFRNSGMEAPEKIPMRRVGQLLVVSTDPTSSLAVVIDSKKEFVVGDRVEMYKGY